jgi:hypothetical protein
MAAVTLSNADIVSRLKLLADSHLKADSGTTTTAVSSELISSSGSLNSFICFINGSNIGVDRIITSFFPETGTMTFDALSNAVTNSDEFCIVSKGFQSDVTQAHRFIENDFKNRGYDIDLFLNADTQLKEMYIYKTIELVCAGLMNDGVAEDIYFVQYNRFKELYEIERSVLTADYDTNEDGVISEAEENQTISYGTMTR